MQTNGNSSNQTNSMNRLSASSSPPAILTVDDDIGMRVLLRHFLYKEGYIIYEAGNGLEAIDAFQENRPDLILLDAMMPKMDGFTACRKIRNLPGGERIPILMVTALNDPESVNRAFEAGADDYIIKPVNRTVLWQRVKYLLRASQSESALHQSYARYHNLFEQAPISLWEEDFSEVKQYLDKLRADENIDDFAAYFDQHPDVVNHCAGLVKVLDINQVTLELYKAESKEELLNNLPQIFGPASRDIFQAELIALTDGQVVFDGEGINYTRQNEPINVKVRWTVAQGYEDTLEKVLVSIVDVTDQRRIEQALMATQKLADLGTLAAGVAHEMNSPLQVITGVSQSLQRRLQNGEVPQNYLRNRLEVIHRNGWRCAEIVRSLKTYAYAAPTETEQYNLNELVNDTLLLIEHQLKSWSNITVTVQLGEALPSLYCDRNQISQIIINLLSNARDAILDSGEIIIKTDYRANDHQIILQIADNGPGIPVAVQKKIFDPFFTTKPIGQGTGLGLFIVYGLMQAYGGTIEIDTAADRGTTFTMFFPVDHLHATVLHLQDKPVGRFDE